MFKFFYGYSSLHLKPKLHILAIIISSLLQDYYSYLTISELKPSTLETKTTKKDGVNLTATPNIDERYAESIKKLRKRQRSNLLIESV